MKNKILRDAFLNGNEGHISKTENHRVIELIFDDEFKDKDAIEHQIHHERKKKIST